MIATTRTDAFDDNQPAIVALNEKGLQPRSDEDCPTLPFDPNPPRPSLDPKKLDHGRQFGAQVTLRQLLNQIQRRLIMSSTQSTNSTPCAVFSE